MPAHFAKAFFSFEKRQHNLQSHFSVLRNASANYTDPSIKWNDAKNIADNYDFNKMNVKTAPKPPNQTKWSWKLRRNLQFKQNEAGNCAETIKSSKMKLKTAPKPSNQTKWSRKLHRNLQIKQNEGKKAFKSSVPNGFGIANMLKILYSLSWYVYRQFPLE